MKIDLKAGDTILGGKFKNKAYVVKSFDVDDNNQPVIKTESGKTLKMLSFRIQKLMPKSKKKEDLKEFKQMIKDAEK